MKIPTKGRYAVAAMMDLAINEPFGPVTIADIAEKQNISLSYLEQLFAELRRKGLVQGTRGPGGGYRLAKPAPHISIAQIIAAVDDKAIEIGRQNNEYLPHTLWADLSKRLFGYLDSISLADSVDSPQVRNWIDAQREPKTRASGRFAA